ncbi:PIN domain-containing protein [Aerosakkonemataceae cyanobacterium BLCC-F50]|uniref:PIN domain-containing protein n=1 Tax=Floridaenema flaviceps BLCC-F50 TaxID=3153642 RepID=A0ABV4Y331_9CYAN
MSIAKGQDAEAGILLRSTPETVRLAMPSICYAEVLSTWQKEKVYSQQFQRELEKQINESKRDLTSIHAKSLVSSLEQVRISSRDRLNDIQERLNEAVDRMLRKAEMITLNVNTVQEISQISLSQPEALMIKDDIVDNLIIKSILSHATSHPTEIKVFLSGNTRDFGTPAVQQVLRDAGINYFSRTQNFLGWLQSR